MIYVTGDTHGDIDIQKLTTLKFPEQKTLTKDNYMLKWFNDKPYTTLFIDGNIDNKHTVVYNQIVKLV